VKDAFKEVTEFPPQHFPWLRILTTKGISPSKKAAKKRSESSDTNESPPSLWMSLIILLVVLAVQVGIAMPFFFLPHARGMHHIEYANARYLLLSVHSNDDTLADWRKFFGTAKYQYDDTNRPTGISYYSHHGMLKPTLTRLAVQLFGPHEVVVRSLCLLFNLACTALLFAFLVIHLRDPWLCGGIALVYITLPLKFTYVDTWKYESAAELFMLTGLVTVSLAGSNRTMRVLYWVSMALMFHTDYPAYLMAGMILGYLLLTRQNEGNWQLFIEGMAACFVGLVTTAAIQFSLGFGEDILTAIKGRIGGQLESIPLLQQARIQLIALFKNLGYVGSLIGIVALIYWSVHRSWKEPVAFAGLAFFSINLAWCLIFRNHVLIHHYAQWFFLPAAALLFALGAADLVKRLGDKKWIVYTALVAMAAFSAFESYIIAADLRPTERDLANTNAVRSVSEPILVGPDFLSGDQGYWKTVVIDLYTDPIYRDSTDVGIRFMEGMHDIGPDSGVFAISATEEAAQLLPAYLDQKLNVGRFDVTQLKLEARAPDYLFIRWAGPAGTPQESVGTAQGEEPVSGKEESP